MKNTKQGRTLDDLSVEELQELVPTLSPKSRALVIERYPLLKHCSTSVRNEIVISDSGNQVRGPLAKALYYKNQVVLEETDRLFTVKPGRRYLVYEPNGDLVTECFSIATADGYGPNRIVVYRE